MTIRAPFRYSALTAFLMLSMAGTLLSPTAYAGGKHGKHNGPVKLEKPAKAFPQMSFSDESDSEIALERIRKSGKVVEFLQAYNLSDQQLEGLFTRDKAKRSKRNKDGTTTFEERSRARLDRAGRLFYVEDAVTGNGALPLTDASNPSAPTISKDLTFKLHSKPGASKTIYLDFNGQNVTGTQWNTSYNLATIANTAFDTDGNAGTFSDAEHAIIQGVWRRVAEDYSAFDVNITTEEPTAEAITRSSSTDANYGTRVIITRNFTAGTAKGNCNCGGFAYVGVFNMTTDLYKPAYVFYDMLSNNEKYIAEAVSHEAGHNLGLSHDGGTGVSYYSGHGSGATGWAPIMGAGYYKPLTQWSKGEYTGANQLQDDYSVMASYGLTFDVDQPFEDNQPVVMTGNNNSIDTATPLKEKTVNGLYAYQASEIISGPSDTDFFKFNSGSGSVSLRATPFTYANAANLDILMKLYNSTGTLIAQSNPADALNATLDVAGLAAGTYYASIEGTGRSAPTTDTTDLGYSKYGSTGYYSLAVSAPIGGTVTPPPPAPNQPPVANFTASATSGYAPLVISFNGTSSSDPDGTIASYAWAFGDGTTASTSTASKTFSTPGLYTVSLNVTDNAGATSSASTTVDVQPSPLVGMSVNSLNLNLIRVDATYERVRATVVIRDQSGKPVSGASVSGSWRGLVSGSSTRTTSSTGTVTFDSPRFAKTRTGTLTFTINNVSKSGYAYDASKNTAGSQTMTLSSPR